MMKMIRWLVSKNGCLVPVVDGTAMCSMVDPIKEAQKWYLSYKDILDDFEHIFVLGIAGGFHVDVLLKEMPAPTITVIEKDSEIIPGLEEKLANWGDRVTVMVSPTSDQIKNYESYHGIFEQASYCVLAHPISYMNGKDYYRQIEDFLLGRNTEGLTYINEIKGQKEPYFQNLQKAYELSGHENIKDIVTKMKKNGGDISDEDLMWLSLGELIH